MRQLALALALFATPMAISAEPSPDSLVHYRHDIMHLLGRHMKATGSIIKGNVDRNQDLAAHATSVHEIAQLVGQLFPAESAPGKVTETEALPAIWADPTAFQAAAQALVDASASFETAAKSGDAEATRAAFFALGKSCGSCHTQFKADDDHDDHDDHKEAQTAAPSKATAAPAATAPASDPHHKDCDCKGHKKGEHDKSCDAHHGKSDCAGHDGKSDCDSDHCNKHKKGKKK